MEKIKLEVAGVPAVLYGKRSRKVYLYVHGKNGSAAEAARFARTACPAGWQVLAVDLPEHGTRKNSPEKLVPWVVTRELQTVYARMQPVWKHIRVYGVSIGAWFAMQALQTQKPEKALLVSPVVDMEKLILALMQQAGVTEEQLRAAGEIPTDFGETLSGPYLCWGRGHGRGAGRHKSGEPCMRAGSNAQAWAGHGTGTQIIRTGTVFQCAPAAADPKSSP